MLAGRRLSRVQVFSAELHLLLEARDQMEESMERFRHALISSDDAWLQFFYPAPKQVSRVEVTEEEVEKEGITFEFEHMDPSVAEDLLAQVMEQAKQGTVKVVDEDWR